MTGRPTASAGAESKLAGSASSGTDELFGEALHDRNSPYAKFLSTELILRDELAIDRTMLANERTLLAYLRSGIALVIAGLTIMEFAQQNWFRVFGMIAIPGGIAASIVGIVRYRGMSGAIALIRKRMPVDSPAPPTKPTS